MKNQRAIKFQHHQRPVLYSDRVGLVFQVQGPYWVFHLYAYCAWHKVHLLGGEVISVASRLPLYVPEGQDAIWLNFSGVHNMLCEMSQNDHQ